MADMDYKAMKTRIEELLENIEKVNQEAASFSAAKAELVRIAGNLEEISGTLTVAIKTAGAVLEQVESVAVSNTLESIKGSAECFDKTGKSLLTGFEGTMKEAAKSYTEASENFAGKISATSDKQLQSFNKKVEILVSAYKESSNGAVNKLDAISGDILTSTKACNEEHLLALQKHIDAVKEDILTSTKACNEDHLHALQKQIDEVAASFQKKMYILGVVAIVSSVVALLLTFL
jgi:bacterioferritin (cytochrome b1)